MVQPASVKNTQNQSIVTLIGADGTARIELGIGDVDVALTPHAAWKGVATHAEADTIAGGDGLVVVAGSYGGVVKPLVVDSLGRFVTKINPANGALTNGSGTISAGGTQQTLFAINTARLYLFVQNLDDGNDLWINFTTAAVQDQPSIRIRPGETFVMESGFISTELVSIIGPTTGQKFTAKEA